MSPTQRTLKHLREQGYKAEVVEKWIPQARRRKDLYGFIDILAIRPGEVLGVQACSGGDVKKRAAKITNHENVDIVRQSGVRILVMGWRKLKSGWAPREIDLS